MQDITDAILRKNLTTESAIEKLFEIHIDRNRGVLNEVGRERVLPWEISLPLHCCSVVCAIFSKR